MSATLDSLLDIAKSLTGTAGAAITGLVAAGVIPLPDGWRGTAAAIGVGLTGFSVWLTKNTPAIEKGAAELSAVVVKADPASQLAQFTAEFTAAHDAAHATPDVAPAV